MIVTFYEFVHLALTIDDAALVFEDSDGWLCVQTNYKVVGDEDAPLAYIDIDPMDDIPWGTPDSWIPDNPDENGMRQSDFI